MKMQSTEMEFVTFDAQDVITTSNTPDNRPLAYAKGSALINGEDSFNMSLTGASSVDAVDYASGNEITAAIGNTYTNYYYIITSVQRAGKSGNGYGVTFDTTPYLSAGESKYGKFTKAMDLRNWLVSYFQQ